MQVFLPYYEYNTLFPLSIPKKLAIVSSEEREGQFTRPPFLVIVLSLGEVLHLARTTCWLHLENANISMSG